MIKKKDLAFILLVLVVGFAFLNLVLLLLYRGEILGGACELCYKLNPVLESCKNPIIIWR